MMKDLDEQLPTFKENLNYWLIGNSNGSGGAAGSAGYASNYGSATLVTAAPSYEGGGNMSRAGFSNSSGEGGHGAGSWRYTQSSSNYTSYFFDGAYAKGGFNCGAAPTMGIKGGSGGGGGGSYNGCSSSSSNQGANGMQGQIGFVAHFIA